MMMMKIANVRRQYDFAGNFVQACKMYIYMAKILSKTVTAMQKLGILVQKNIGKENFPHSHLVAAVRSPARAHQSWL